MEKPVFGKEDSSEEIYLPKMKTPFLTIMLWPFHEQTESPVKSYLPNVALVFVAR